MTCPRCFSDQTRVLRTTETKNGYIKRRRECMACKKRWTTLEVQAVTHVGRSGGTEAAQ